MTKILISTCIFFNSDYSNKLLKTFPYLVDSLHILRELYDVDMIVYYDSTVPEHIIEYYKDKGIILKRKIKVKVSMDFFGGLIRIILKVMIFIFLEILI